MNTYKIVYSGYGETNRVQFNIQAASLREASGKAEQVLGQLFKSLSFTVFTICKVA